MTCLKCKPVQKSTYLTIRSQKSCHAVQKWMLLTMRAWVRRLLRRTMQTARLFAANAVREGFEQLL